MTDLCRFPDCKCPMDPGPALDWCAIGLPHAKAARAAPTLEEAYAEGRADERQQWIDRGVLVDCPDCHGAGEREVYDTNGGPDVHSEIATCPGCDGDGFARHAAIARSRDGSPLRSEARPSDPDLNPVSVKDLSASASPATKEQQ